jgi:hypothetical protein
MRFYGLVDRRLIGSELGEVVELFASREEAEDALRQVLEDEPDLTVELYIEELDLET